ncbi:hypothetical protein B9Z39_02360 [Limnohabitans sp. JirII-29]|nr:hypothetical protein B9Z39_02360 [Limnohabitans sp. JirII-29]
MTDAQMVQYVQVSATVLGLPVDEARVVRVAAHLQRTAAMAQLLDGLDMPPELELPEIYCPKQVTP